MSSDPEVMKLHPAHPESAPAAAPSVPGAPPAYTAVDLSEEQPGTTNVTVVTAQPTAQAPAAPAPAPMVVQQVQLQFGAVPMRMTCPNCKAEITTTIDKKTGPGAWLWCLLLSCFGCICGCCVIPFFTDGTKIHSHHCPNCKQLVGQYRGSASCA